MSRHIPRALRKILCLLHVFFFYILDLFIEPLSRVYLLILFSLARLWILVNVSPKVYHFDQNCGPLSVGSCTILLTTCSDGNNESINYLSLTPKKGTSRLLITDFPFTLSEHLSRFTMSSFDGRL